MRAPAVNTAPTIQDKQPAMSSLVKRTLAGAVLAAVMIGATLTLPTLWFALLTAAFVLVGTWEWSAMAGWTAPGRRLAYAACSGLVLLATAWLVQSEAGLWAVLLAGLAWWLVALAWVVRAQQGLPVDALDYPPVRLVAGWLLVAPAFGALVGLHAVPESGPLLVVYLLVLVSTADSAAYFVGRRLGKRRLASNVSPGKSLEGVAGAMVAVAVVAVAAVVLGGFDRPLAFLVSSLVTALASILGDLAESTFKRRAGVKDSGSIIPGHGGILDRIDGYTAAAPIFALGCLWQGIAL